ncbi:CPBP family intramembrane glutamic endopeptidase [Streptomyces sp. NPDC029526]|uniref:CPBP family intramembrane glutamic endopeptidase n=1 Tax=Streptomyces sp. NPDC029526 TaxID=3155728 RepID=UPI0033DAC274
MNRLLLVLAVAPVFALSLGTVIAATLRFRLGGAGGRRAVERLAPVLYAATVTAAALLAAALTGFDPVRLGVTDGSAPDPWLLAAATSGGVVAGAAGYFGELLLAHRASTGTHRASRASDRPVRAPSAGTRSLGAWTAEPRALLALGLLTGLAEEVLFRGYLLTGLHGSLPLWAALAVQAALFAVHHASFGLRAVPAKAVHGLVWGVLTVAAGSLLPAVAAHLVFQFLVCRRLTRPRPTDPTQEGGAADDRTHGTTAVRRPPVAG